MSHKDGDRLRHLRNEILTALHTGRLAPGDRLSSVRAVAERMAIDPRTALDLYRTLAGEGLVDIRPRSGVYLASNRSPTPDVQGETVRWVATTVVAGAWRRRIPLPELPALLETALAGGLVCACIDEVSDERFAICRELARDFGMEVRDVEPLSDSRVLVDGEERKLEAALRGVDLVLVTAFHDREVRPIAERVDLPLVIATQHPSIVQELDELGAERLVFVVADLRAAPRLKQSFGSSVDVVDVSSYGNWSPPEGARVVFSAAAADAFGDLPDGAFVPRTPTISPETAESLAHWMVELNLREGEGRS